MGPSLVKDRLPPAPSFPHDWTWHHQHAIRSLDDIEKLFPGRFDLSSLDKERVDAAADLYAMCVTPYYLSLAKRASPDDPIWAQAIPTGAELVTSVHELDDPIGDSANGLRPAPFVTRRYPDRALLFPTSFCSVHCRHCFRKTIVGQPDSTPSPKDLQKSLEWIAENKEIHEVILTGGDPLTLSDSRLARLLEQLGEMDHLWSLRIHSRMAVTNPFRITEDLVQLLSQCTTPVTLVSHFNHPVEVTDETMVAANRLRRGGISLLNQSVLLSGINDDPSVHRELIWSLIRAGIQPYALHHADLVPGTGHFRTTIEKGQSLISALRGTVPGYAVPRYLLDIPGGHGKVPIEAPWLVQKSPSAWEILAPSGSRHEYNEDAFQG